MTDDDKLALEKVCELIGQKMEQKFFGSILVPMKYGKIGKLKLEEIVDISEKQFND